MNQLSSMTAARSVGENALPNALIEQLMRGVTGPAAPVTTISPLDGRTLAAVPQSTPKDVEAAFDRARAAQRRWATVPVKQRAAPFLKFHDLMLARQAQALDIVQWETGKARLHALEELMDGVGSTLYFARRAPKLLSPKRRAGALPLFTQTRETYHPKGVVTTITPWNYPLSLTMDVIPALLAGNAVVHKPDTQTALSSLWPRMLLIEAGLPADLWQVVVGQPADIGDTLIDNADFVCFTGSTAAGKAIATRAAANLTGCSLELGGKNPMLVLRDADIEATAAAAVRGCFANAGQLCVSIERIYVDKAIYQQFIDTFGARIRALPLSAAMEFTGSIGSLTSAKQLDRVKTHVQDAVAAGAVVVAGGTARPDIGPYFYEPTVLIDVPPTAKLYREETFGPVVTIVPFDSEDEAIALANDTEYGLNAAVFSKDVKRARRIAARIQAGTVNINEGYAASYASQDAPMGGMKQSGLGRRHGTAGLMKYVEPQNISAQHVVGFDPAFGRTPAQHAAFLLHAMKTMKAARIR
ncbi:succinic semialdehyde dehydrogenase [Nocardia sp. CA-119907]|uniref:succinic semialdehyde dehydrogenase n=1 Tax=Nocardia sp. CA-119907 TaxID=3239973 RepID=UPI003D962749